MWAVAKPQGTGQDEFLLYYTGSNGSWSTDQTRAARWIDRRDAWQAIKDNRYHGIAETVFVSNPRKADPDQERVREELMLVRQRPFVPSANNM